MKISKLFHWLYAILMLLPFAFFVPSVLYYAFNDNATMQNVEVSKKETISVDFNQYANSLTNEYWTYYQAGTISLSFSDNSCDVVVTNYEGTGGDSIMIMPTYDVDCIYGHKYLCLTEWVVNEDLGNPLIGPLLEFNSVYTNGTRIGNTNNYYFYFVGGTDNPNTRIFLKCTGEKTIGDSWTWANVQFFDLTQMFGSGNEPTIIEFNQMFPNSYYPYTVSELKQITYDTGEIEQLVSNTDIINYAWESIWYLPLFSWTKVTFVSVPFAFLTGIFGLGASNSINYVFGYFLTISIVWLVFDVIMYVPMLVHRWIDKARIE